MVAIKRRAVSVAQKEQRRQDILQSARELFTTHLDYDSLLMKHVAENISLTKGTLYLYFKTKEEVFLALYTEEFNLRFDVIDSLLAAYFDVGTDADNRNNGIDIFLSIMTESMLEQQTFLRLNSLLHTVLEQNIELDCALEFKTLLRDRLNATGAGVEKVLPFLKEGQGTELLLMTHELMIGCFHASTPTPCLEEVLQRPDMIFMKLDFEVEFSKAIRLILLGYESLNKSG